MLLKRVRNSDDIRLQPGADGRLLTLNHDPGRTGLKPGSPPDITTRRRVGATALHRSMSRTARWKHPKRPPPVVETRQLAERVIFGTGAATEITCRPNTCVGWFQYSDIPISGDSLIPTFRLSASNSRSCSTGDHRDHSLQALEAVTQFRGRAIRTADASAAGLTTASNSKTSLPRV